MKRLGNLFRRDPTNGKEDAELAYWRERRAEQGPLEQGAPLYRTIFVDHFGLDESFYAGKRLLDIGCGPRGSLTWAGDAVERVGLDPLVSKYGELQQGDHGMTTPTEPHELDWDLIDRFAGAWQLIERRDFERPSDNLHANLVAGVPFDHSDPRPRPGVLSARFERR